MFVWNITKGAYKFSEKEEKIIRWYLDVLIKECPRTCSFLTQVHLDETEFYWAPYMTTTDGIMGAWCITSPKRIYMRDIAEHIAHAAISRKCRISEEDTVLYNKTSSLIEYDMMMTLVHELIHKLQFQCAPVPYVFNRLVTILVDHVPFLEQIGIEYDARANSDTEELEEFVVPLQNSIMSYYSAIRMKKPDDPDNWLYKNWAGVDGYDPGYSDKIRQYTIEYFKFFESLND